MKKGLNKNLLICLLGVILIVAGVVLGVLNGPEKKQEKKEEKKEEVTITPLMYEVTKEGSDNKIYLFGSVHVGKDMKFPEYVEKAWADSDYLAVEYNILTQIEEMQVNGVDETTNYYPDGTLLKDHLDEELYTKLIELLKEKGIYDEKYEKYTVDAIEDVLSSYFVSKGGYSAFEGVDLVLLNRAKKENKQVLEVESREFQDQLFAGFPERLHVITVGGIVKDIDRGVEELNALYEAWKKGDPDKIYELSKSDFSEEDLAELSEEDQKIIEQYNIDMLDNRNVAMAEKFDMYFNSNQKVLFTVGCAHLVGPNGIAKLLEQKGYTVTQVNIK